MYEQMVTKSEFSGVLMFGTLALIYFKENKYIFSWSFNWCITNFEFYYYRKKKQKNK
jgi:hypothetical protein